MITSLIYHENQDECDNVIDNVMIMVMILANG